MQRRSPTMKSGRIVLIALVAAMMCLAPACMTTDSAGQGGELLVSPASEYYLGRTVGATILSKYKASDRKEANHYLNVIGQLLAQASDRPETFGGYHFLLLETGEINAFAAPGGLIFVSSGLLRCCSTEDAIAAVLAHEIAHVQLQHGLKTIHRNRTMQGYRRSRMTDTLTVAGLPMARQLMARQLLLMSLGFETTVGDMTHVLFTGGYSRQFESEADRVAIEIMDRVGYDVRAFGTMLSVMKTKLAADPRGFAKTHPDMQTRINDIESILKEHAPSEPSPARQGRFKEALAGI